MSYNTEEDKRIPYLDLLFFEVLRIQLLKTCLMLSDVRYLFRVSTRLSHYPDRLYELNKVVKLVASACPYLGLMVRSSEELLGLI